MEKKTSGEQLKKKRERSSSYPQFNIKECMDFAEKVFEMGPKNVLLDEAAKRAGYRNKEVGSFLGLRAAARYFGLVKYDKDYISVTDPLINVLLEKSNNAKNDFVRKLILFPTLYKKVFDNFAGKQLPNEEDLARRLSIDEQYGISKEASKSAAKVFRESVKFADLLDSNDRLKSPDEVISKMEEKDKITSMENERPGPIEEDKGIKLDRYEITLQMGVKISLLLPPILPQKDKQRIKTMIDLIPEGLDAGE
ncbi:MAG: hypothetical protein ABSG71_10955 [Thermodesulfobacteriota bacterium]|jgi:hypothetical protein